MAEAKYDLLLVPTKTDKKIYNQPWYKERLRTRYIKSLKPTDTSQFVQGKNWTFVKDGLDDFRDGLPPPVEGGIVLQGSKGLAPNIQGSSDNVSSVKQPAARGRFNKHEVCFSRVTPQQQHRREHIEEIEYGLMQHPLALYPHLEECMPPDVFEDVVDILDPEMNLGSEDEDEEYYEDEVPSESEVTVSQQQQEQEEATDEGTEISIKRPLNRNFSMLQKLMPAVKFLRSRKSAATAREILQLKEPEPLGDEKQVRNPYRWIPRKDDKENEKKDKKQKDRRTSSPSQDEHIKKVTKEFCDWVSSLGGESNNIEESTITSLFASGYETKPALSVPIHVVELTNVPLELRNSANVPPPPEEQATATKVQAPKKKDWIPERIYSLPNIQTRQTYSGSYEPSWLKIRYGAWYLSPKTWKRRTAEEPLQDPKEIKNQEMSEAKKNSAALDGDLAPMHGAKAFMDFIDKKATRRPEFLDRVAEIQEQTAKEEQAKLAAELAKQKKQNERKAISAK